MITFYNYCCCYLSRREQFQFPSLFISSCCNIVNGLTNILWRRLLSLLTELFGLNHAISLKSSDLIKFAEWVWLECQPIRCGNFRFSKASLLELGKLIFRQDSYKVKLFILLGSVFQCHLTKGLSFIESFQTSDWLKRPSQCLTRT